MKKIIFFLITLTIFSFIGIKNAYAQTSFYEGDYIANIWLNKKNPTDGLIYYNQARFIKQVGTNKIAYCLEPFIYFDESGLYTETTSPINLTPTQIESIILTAHFGYGYENHTDPKWYAVTQMMIWKIAFPNAQYYYTSSKNGSEINFTTERSEIQTLVDNYLKDTSFNNNTYTIVANNKFIKTDTNYALSSYIPIESQIKTSDNLLETPVLTAGTYTVNLEKKSLQHNQPVIFYQSPTNQDLIKVGDPPTRINKFTINVIETKIKITKLDKDTNEPNPQGDAKISGTILSLYDKNNLFIKDILLDETGTITLNNLDFGSYYIKEKTPGTGYKLNNKIYSFTLDENNYSTELNITNEVIKGKLKIIKEYGYKNNFKPEANISFNIYDKKQKLLQTITTNKDGIAEINLPYGKYTLVQLTTTEGYQKIEPIKFEITNDNETIEYNLKNYKIEVPNTKTTSLLKRILNFIKDLLC